MTSEIQTPDIEERKARARASLAKAREAKAQKQREAALKPKEAETTDERRTRLLRELSELPDPPPVAKGARPGDLIKDGMGFDKIPWTAQRLREACDRGDVIDGVPFGWKTLYGDGKILSSSWNGIVYWLWPDRENKLPSPVYWVFMQAMEDRKRESNRWRGPGAPNPSELDGFNSAEAHSSEIGAPSNLGHVMGVGPLEPRG